MLLDDRPDTAPETDFPQVPTTRHLHARVCRTCDKRFLAPAGSNPPKCTPCIRAQRHARELAAHPELFAEGGRRECVSCGKRHELRHFRVKGNSRKAYLSNSCDACISERQSKVRAARRKGEEIPAIGEDLTIALIQEMCDLNRRVTRMRFDGRLREAQPLLAKVAQLRYALCIDTDTVNGATRSQVLAGWTGLDGLGASLAETP